MYEVNAGLDVIEFASDFTKNLHHIARDNEAFLAEMKATDRFKRAMEKLGASSEPIDS